MEIRTKELFCAAVLNYANCTNQIIVAKFVPKVKKISSPLKFFMNVSLPVFITINFKTSTLYVYNYHEVSEEFSSGVRALTSMLLILYERDNLALI